jgi:acyl carrier protein/NAD(P)-dependent dehydrogenase (short-subunit alcohol dehydrogenase family)
MAEIKSDARPPAAALVTGAETPEGQSVAASLARAGYRICLLRSGQGAPEPSSLPGFDQLKHVSVDLETPDAAGYAAAAARALALLGHATALVHVALPKEALPKDAEAPESALLGAYLGAQAGAFLALGLALLPSLFATQTGTLCVLTRKPESLADAPAGSGALLGALLGAVRELAERTAGTPLRSIALYSEGARAPLEPPALTALTTQLGFEPSPGLIESGWFASLSGPSVSGPLELLSPPLVGVAPPVAAAAPAAAPAPAPGRDRIAVQLAQTFRSAFGLAPNEDVSNLRIGSVKRWDSLGHLKLMMEVEQALRVRLPADALSKIQSYRDLERAVRANLPAK